MKKISQMNSRKPKKFKLTPAKFIIGTLMILFAITGCSDMPYTGSTLTVHEVDRYLVSTDGNAVCFQDELDSTCIKLTLATGAGADTTNGPAIYIYPERRLYTFYHEGNPILRAERIGDNNDNNGNNNGNGDNDGNNGSPPNDGNPGNNGTNPTTDPPADGPSTPNGQDTNNNKAPTDPTVGPPQRWPSTPNGQDTNNDNADGHGWIIWVYYPEGAIFTDAPTLSESGVTVTLNGKLLTDADITGFARFIGPNDEKGIQFFYPTQSAELLDLKIRMEGVVAEDDPVKFNINYLWNSQ